MIPVGTKVRVRALESTDYSSFSMRGEVTSHHKWRNIIYNTVRLPSGTSIGLLDSELEILDDE